MIPNRTFREYRKSKGLTQVAFAARIEMSQGVITDIERGRIKTSKKVCSKIKEVFGDDYIDITVEEKEFKPIKVSIPNQWSYCPNCGYCLKKIYEAPNNKTTALDGA